MKNTKLLLLFLLTFCANLTAQKLTIKRGPVEKIFSESSFFEIYVNDRETQADSCCGNIFLYGKIVDIDKDSISMNLSDYRIKSTKDGVQSVMGKYIEAGDFPYKFSPTDMTGMSVFKSSKAKKRKKGFQTAGGLLFFTGAATGLVSFLADEKSAGRKKILLASAIQLGTSFTFIKMGSVKKYSMKSNKRGYDWKVKL